MHKITPKVKIIMILDLYLNFVNGGNDRTPFDLECIRAPRAHGERRIVIG